MIYHLSRVLQRHISTLNVVHYVSFRSIAALLTALLISLLFGDWFIGWSRQLFRSKSREFTPENHKNKDGMPTMGGIFILFVVAITTLVWCDLSNALVWIMLAGVLGFGAIGAWDDWAKITQHKGISARHKFVLQWSVALIVSYLLVAVGNVSTVVSFPFFKQLQVDLGILFVLWAAFIVVGCSNAVNLTDGLDGLAIGSLIPNFATFSVIAYAAGHHLIAGYLMIPFAATAEIAIVGAVLVGASLGFLWYNSYPAQIFMGDVGSLGLGAALALMALMAKQELLLPIAGGLFMAETLSVMMQVFSVKRYGKRIFRMAPIHHHFELLGWAESKITVRFAIISFVLCLLALMTLKLR